MTFLLDLFDVIWFFDNFGEELLKLINKIGEILGKLFNGSDEEASTQAE